MVNKDRTWAEISLKNIEKNLNLIKKHTKTKVMCIVKADAYGHGLMQVSGALARASADYFGVATLSEAILLRQSGLDTPILLLGFFEEQYATDIIENNITTTVYEKDTAEILSKCAKKLGKIAKIHIKVDTGMSRLGFLHYENLISEICEIYNMENLELEGIFTHFSVADNPAMEEFTNNQAKRFENLCENLEKEGIFFKLKHISASSALIQYEHLRYDMVRAGIALFGYYPDENIDKTIDLEPCMTLYSRIAQVKTLKTGESVSYGRRYTADTDKKIAIVSIGYADGYFRANTNVAYMLVNGKKAKVLGSVCMDMTVIDVTDCGQVKKGDKVVVFGENGLFANDLAEFSNTITYEVLCAVSKRVPRIY